MIMSQRLSAIARGLGPSVAVPTRVRPGAHGRARFASTESSRGCLSVGDDHHIVVSIGRQESTLRAREKSPDSRRTAKHASLYAGLAVRPSAYSSARRSFLGPGTNSPPSSRDASYRLYSSASTSASRSASKSAASSAACPSSSSPKPKPASKQFFDDDRWQADYLESLMKKAGALTLKFTTIDADGNVHTEQGTYKKADLCKEHDLDPRDLRKLDSLQPNLVPTILSRKSAIIVNMLHVRALIKADAVILFDPAGSGESRLKTRLLWHLQGNLKARRRKEKTLLAMDACVREEPTWETNSTELDDRLDLGLSYEHRALESILVSVANALEEEMTYTRTLVGDLLADLEEGIRRENLKMLLHYSRRLAGFHSRVRYVLASIEEVLESDEDLSNMYLSAKVQSRPRGLLDHEELELLLESFSKQVEEIVSEVETVVANMQSTQEIAELMLDSNRNTLIAMDLKVSIGTLGLGTGAVITGLFGMNLTSHIEQNAWAFCFVSGSALSAALLITTIGLRRLARMRRIGVNSHNPWEEFGSSQHGSKSSVPVRAQAQEREEGRKGGLMRWLIGGFGSWRRMRVRNATADVGGAALLGASTLDGNTVTSTTSALEQRPLGPVWINKKADEARARDAMRQKRLDDEEREAEWKAGRKGERDRGRSFATGEGDWKASSSGARQGSKAGDVLARWRGVKASVRSGAAWAR